MTEDVRCTCWYVEKLEKILSALEEDSVTWGYAEINKDRVSQFVITPENQAATVTYYKKYAGDRIVHEICNHIRREFGLEVK